MLICVDLMRVCRSLHVVGGSSHEAGTTTNQLRKKCTLIFGSDCWRLHVFERSHVTNATTPPHRNHTIQDGRSCWRERNKKHKSSRVPRHYYHAYVHFKAARMTACGILMATHDVKASVCFHARSHNGAQSRHKRCLYVECPNVLPMWLFVGQVGSHASRENTTPTKPHKRAPLPNAQHAQADRA